MEIDLHLRQGVSGMGESSLYEQSLSLEFTVEVEVDLPYLHSTNCTTHHLLRFDTLKETDN